jgi:hypothetical protein
MFRIWSRFAYLFVSRALKEKALKAKQFKEANRQKARCRSASPLRAWCNFSICFFCSRLRPGFLPRVVSNYRKARASARCAFFHSISLGFRTLMLSLFIRALFPASPSTWPAPLLAPACTSPSWARNRARYAATFFIHCDVFFLKLSTSIPAVQRVTSTGLVF